MKRLLYISTAALAGTALSLFVVGYWHEMQKADKSATQYMRVHHPSIAATAKGMGDTVRRVAQ